MELAHLFADHIRRVQATYEQALEGISQAQSIEAVLIHSGSEGIYFADDRHIPFLSFGHFRHWVPLNRPNQMVLVQPGRKPKYFQVIPPDFWYEQTVVNESWWADQFDIIELDEPDGVLDHLPDTRRIAFLGENTSFAADITLPAYLHNEKNLKNYLDYYRAMKSDYEVHQITEANRRGMIGHEAARRAFEGHGSEWDIHRAFLEATQMTEFDSPYTNIIALDEKAAILHYQYKRHNSGAQSRVLLIDAGCTQNGYCSDITRTYARDTVHPVFKSLLHDMNRLQLELVKRVEVGVAYAEIHQAAHDAILDLLLAHDIVRGDRAELEKTQVAKLFFPHGIGHLLGLQVHDVGGFLTDEHGALAPPPEEHKFLRLNRPMAAGMVFTIEPGIYFIPVLLDPERRSDKRGYFNWPLIDELIPLGGIRIEDNVLVTANGPANLTRPGA